MYDNREPVKNGGIITHNGRNLRVTELIGRGGNTLVYKAEYSDSFIGGGIHVCVVKELFPLHPKGGVYRGEDGRVHYDGTEDFFRTHKQSFISGNKVHLDILKSEPDSVGANFDSFEENNTVYSVLGLNSAYTLRQKFRAFQNLSEILQIIIKLLKAVCVFHNHHILHLDISPDNVILSSSNGEERVLLIDFNGSGGECISINPQYSAPEIKLGRRNNISEASDIFSICAVFVYLISGRDFVYAALNLNELKKSEALREIPQTAMSFLLGMLAKGLRSKPSLRFKSVHEMLNACHELQNRLDNIGITHASLWEASRLMRGSSEKELLDNNISSDGKIISSRQIFALGNTVLIGEGGIGKTTLYKQLWYKSTNIYAHNEPLSFFIPLNKYDGKTDFIKRYIVSKIKFGGGISTVSDAVKKLTELMSENKPFMQLMLDGFNEMSADGDIIREIDELGKMPGVTVSVSARADTLTDYLKDFTLASLMPLEDGQVCEYLNTCGIAYPDDEGLARLLTNPLMLTLYCKSESVFQKSADVKKAVATREEIIYRYLESIVEARKQATPEDMTEQIRLRYILKFLFPALCAKANKRAALDFNAIRKICEKDYKRIKSRAFSREFKEFSGKSQEVLGGAKNAEEWMNIAFNSVLLRDTALMVSENDTYYPLHMNFSECLSSIHKQNMKRYRKAVLGIRVPLTAAVIAVCLCASSVTYYYLPGTHPIGSREMKSNYEIMTLAAHSLNNVTQMTVNEGNLIEQLKNTDEGLTALKNTGKKLDALGDAVVTADNLNEIAYRGLDTDRIEKLLAMSAEHRVFQREMFTKLEYTLSPQSVYTEADIEKELGYYKEYLSDYEKLMGYELCLITRTINDSGGDVIKEAMIGRGNIVMSFNNALEIKTKDLENSINSLELNLKSLETKLGLIQGGSL